MFKNLIFIIVALLCFMGCGEDAVMDPCTTINCGENAICLDGNCDCNDGYYGTFCDSLIQDKFLGDWSGIDCENENFNVTFREGNNILNLILENDYQIEIIDENSFNIIDLEFTILDKLYVSGGFGKLLEDGLLEFTATLSENGVAFPPCVIFMTKD